MLAQGPVFVCLCSDVHTPSAHVPSSRTRVDRALCALAQPRPVGPGDLETPRTDLPGGCWQDQLVWTSGGREPRPERGSR